jgi:hypothetical protein
MTDHFDPEGPFEPIDTEPPDPELLDPYEDLLELGQGDEPARPEPIPITDPMPQPRSPLLTGLIVLIVLVVLSIAAYQFLSDDETDDTATPTTTTTAPTDDTTPATTGTSGPTTTAEPGTTTAPGDGFEPYQAQGAAVPVGELKLQVDAIGPIALGSPADEAVGRLITSLGEPDEDSGPVTSTGAFGACEGDTERIVRFGALVAVVVVDDDGTETFAGYRLDLAYGGLSSDAVNLETLSGLAVGNSIAQLERIYDRFDVKILTDPDLGDVFELRNSSGALLLWGPVSSPASDGFVRGIYSPDACGRFT